MGELRAEVAGVKQDLQDVMELCGQQEALIEERNRSWPQEIRCDVCV